MIVAIIVDNNEFFFHWSMNVLVILTASFCFFLIKLNLYTVVPYIKQLNIHNIFKIKGKMKVLNL